MAHSAYFELILDQEKLIGNEQIEKSFKSRKSLTKNKLISAVSKQSVSQLTEKTLLSSEWDDLINVYYAKILPTPRKFIPKSAFLGVVNVIW